MSSPLPIGSRRLYDGAKSLSRSRPEWPWQMPGGLRRRPTRSDHDSVPLEEALAKHREFIMKTKCADYVFN